MSYTSAQSGDNYRNWWPHPTMARFVDSSIDLMEELARESGNRLGMSRRGYLLATRQTDVATLVDELTSSYAASGSGPVRVHDVAGSGTYAPAADDWASAPDGVDVLTGAGVVRERYAYLADDIASLIHIRRGGDFASQQMGAYMLEQSRPAGVSLIRGDVARVEAGRGYRLSVETPDGDRELRVPVFINAAGPFATTLAADIGVALPVSNVFQQKIAFEDTLQAVPRELPFLIDIDDCPLNWSDEERELLAVDPDLRWLTERLTGGVHVRPEGGHAGRWVKLGWAYNTATSEPCRDLASEHSLDPQFLELALRRASQVLPALGNYLDAAPTRRSHYGGYYTMTEENWPIIGPAGPDGGFIIAALSGFGCMAACAAGKLCADWVNGVTLPDYAHDLSLARYDNADLLAALQAGDKGLL